MHFSISSMIKILLSVFSLITLNYLLAQSEMHSGKIQKQDYYQYEEDFLTPLFHAQRREALRALMPDSTATVVFAAPERNRSNDVYYEYHQDPDFYYLTGFREPNAVMVIFKEKHLINGDSLNEIIFIPKRNPFMEMWNGRRLGVENGQLKMGIQRVLENSDFKEIELPFKGLERTYFLKPYALEDLDESATDNITGIWQAFQEKYPEPSEISEEHLRQMMDLLRQEKQEEELKLMKKAIDITCEAQIALMKQISEEMTEFQTEAIIEYEFKKRGAEHTGFPSIQGSGENSCILHYTSNRRPMKGGGLLVSDVGAEYHGYTADVTRTIPPSGKFSKEERAIYELVLRAQSAGIEASTVGASFRAPHQVAVDIIAEGLVEMGICKKKSDYRDYFMHGTSHYLGLDVHDAGLYGPLAVNQVITVEPGIYIAENSNCDPKWWNIGVRIEDDILITAEGPINLSAKAPRTIEEIEELMKR